MAIRSLLEARAGQFAYAHLACATVGRPCPLPTEDRQSSGVDQVLHDAHYLGRDKRAFIEYEPENAVPTQGNRPRRQGGLLSSG